jgi:hypothetical protein
MTAAKIQKASMMASKIEMAWRREKASKMAS